MPITRSWSASTTSSTGSPRPLNGVSPVRTWKGCSTTQGLSTPSFWTTAAGSVAVGGFGLRTCLPEPRLHDNDTGFASGFSVPLGVTAMISERGQTRTISEVSSNAELAIISGGHLLIFRAMQYGLAFLAGVIVTRALGPSGRAAYVLPLAFTATIVVLIHLS